MHCCGCLTGRLHRTTAGMRRFAKLCIVSHICDVTLRSKTLVSHLDADGAHIQEDGKGLPDLVVQAPLPDKFDEQLVHLQVAAASPLLLGCSFPSSCFAWLARAGPFQDMLESAQACPRSWGQMASARPWNMLTFVARRRGFNAQASVLLELYLLCPTCFCTHESMLPAVGSTESARGATSMHGRPAPTHECRSY